MKNIIDAWAAWQDPVATPPATDLPRIALAGVPFSQQFISADRPNRPAVIPYHALHQQHYLLLLGRHSVRVRPHQGAGARAGAGHRQHVPHQMDHHRPVLHGDCRHLLLQPRAPVSVAGDQGQHVLAARLPHKQRTAAAPWHDRPLTLRAPGGGLRHCLLPAGCSSLYLWSSGPSRPS